MKAVRRKLRRTRRDKIIFVDETYIKENIYPLTTLVTQGDLGKVKVKKPSTFAQRLDIIAGITVDGPLPLKSFTPQQRKKKGSKGITKSMFLDYVSGVLAPAASAMDLEDATLVLDRSKIHNVADIEAVLDNEGCDNIKHILMLPKETAKHVSPLDNALFHEFKEDVRKEVKGKIVSLDTLKSHARRVWERFSPKQITAHYRHCRLYPRQKLDDDLSSSDQEEEEE